MSAASKPRAPAVSAKLEAACAALWDLEQQTGQAALDAAEDRPGGANT